MIDRSKSIIADEGVPVLLGLASVAALLWYFGGVAPALPVLALLAAGCALFRDPRRGVSGEALAVVSPVDGRVVRAERTGRGVLHRPAQRIVIRVNRLGTYTARAPVEGKVMDLHADLDGGARARVSGGLWLQTDEGADLVLRLRGNPFGLVPAAIVGYGARVGQGQRCAYLRWARFADLELPETSRITVSEGERVRAGGRVAELSAPEGLAPGSE
ncbi:MAG TPA: hypothetical protein VF200_10935 [Woeseiaceae bacterium]